MPRLTPLFTSLLLAGLLSGGIASAAEPTTLMKARINAVSVAKAGHLDEGIARLEALHRSNPKDAYVTADLIVLLRLAGQNQRIAELTKQMNPDDIPDYARMDLAHALRDEKQFERARAVLANHQKALGLSGQILYAMVTLESRHPKEAVAALPNRHAKGLTAVDLANMAYVYRWAGRPEMALSLAQQALRLSPNDPHALREDTFALSDLGASKLALKQAKKNRHLFSPQMINQLQADATSDDTLEAVKERRRLENLYKYKERNLPLEATLAELEKNRQAFTQYPQLELQTRYDQIFVWRQLDLMTQAVSAFEALPQHPVEADAKTLKTIPPYVRLAAADAYLYLKHPNEAARLYESVIKEDPGTDVEHFMSLYFAYIDGEHYDKAEPLIEHLHKVTPAWSRKVAGEPNWERVDVDLLWAMDPAYRNDESLSEQRLRKLFDAAPRNTDILNSLATIERWRGWPEQSMQTTRMAEAYEPKSKDTRVNLANDNRDLEHFPLWGQQINALYSDFPTDTTIQKSLAQWNDRSRPSITSEYTTGKSNGGSNNGNPVNGNRDQELQTRLNSPWTNTGWRAFLDQHYIWSSYEEGPLSFNRLGAGVEWRGDRKHFWAMVDNDQLTGNHVGLSAGWSQWINDHWQYSISGSTYSLDTPLRAKEAGYSGKSISGDITWRQSESREAYLGLGLLSISDGNKRVDFSTGITQRLFASPHHITSGGIDLFAEHNSQPGGAYFNPSSSESASVRLEHEWITWRHYERSFTQYFKVSTGYGWQADYGGSPTVDLFYEHKWKFSRTWDLHYGVGWGSNVYDGGREHRLYGLIGFGGVF